MSTELTTPNAQELEKRDEELAAGSLANIRSEDRILPIVKLTQQLSREVTDGDAEAGHFVNNVTGEDYGEKINFVVAHYYVGRFYSDDERSYTASSDVAPANWPQEFAGKPFADIPQAEEQHKRRANDPDDDFKWGSGPPIETTHNFIGFLAEEPDIPVRLSLKSTSTPAARKMTTLASVVGSFWASTFEIEAALRENKAGKPYYVAVARKGEQTTPEQRAQARLVADQAQKAQFALTGDEPEEKPGAAKPDKPSAAVDVV